MQAVRAAVMRTAAQGVPISKPMFCRSFATHKGSCHCGDVHFEVEGKPDWSAICHCSICRRTHSAPYAELVAYKPDAVKITQGESNLRAAAARSTPC